MDLYLAGIQGKTKSFAYENNAQKTGGVYVIAEGVHFCMTSRGVKKQDASMVTSAIRGVFESNAQARAEFLALIK